MGQADPILTKLNAGPAAKKLVETAIALSNSTDPQQRNHAYSFMESAIRELEDDDKEDDTVQEEELSNHNQGARTTGSEQSTKNEEPYPGEGKDTTNGEKPMQGLEGTENQFNEMGGMPHGMPPGIGEMPPQMGPGLDPNIANQMGAGMPQLPPMSTPQQMQQMQYTVDAALKKYHETVIKPSWKEMNKNIKETKAHNGTMKLDIDNIRNNASAKFRETVGDTIIDPHTTLTGSLQPRTNTQREKVAIVRSEIKQYDKLLNTQKNPMYN